MPGQPPRRTTITADTSPVTAVRHAVGGGRFLLRLVRDDGPGRRHAHVLDDAGNVIGDASDFLYGGRGFSVHTRPFAGYVPVSNIDFVD